MSVLPAAQQAPNLLGVDVGFSARAKSTGLAWRVDGKLGGVRIGSSWTARAAALPAGITFDMAALDAPLVPPGAANPCRGCEAVFYRGTFAKRCRPGMSHFGQGSKFRDAGADAAAQFAAVVGNGHRLTSIAVPGAAMVEAFPNTFMGVLLQDAEFATLETKRSGKSDRLYEACLRTGAFARVVATLGWPTSDTVERLAAERDHDIRAAFVCLLTAGFAQAGTATVVGDDIGGWFWLPPLELWADWAREAVLLTLASARKRGYPGVSLVAADTQLS